MPGEWLGVFVTEQDELPQTMFQTMEHFRPELSKNGIVQVPAEIPIFQLGHTSHLLTPLQRPANQPHVSIGVVRRIRIVVTNIKKADAIKSAEKGLAKYLAPLHMLTFDPSRWKWPCGSRLHAYTAKLGRRAHKPRSQLSFPLPTKWRHEWPPGYQVKWQEVWYIGRSMKEAGFLWSILHKAVAVNLWRHCGSHHTSEICPCCEEGDPESIQHCFHSCPGALQAWDFATSVLYHAAGFERHHQPWPRLSWAQCVLGVDLPPQLEIYQHLWSLLRGSAIWVIWISRNAHVFTTNRWTQEALEVALWDVFLDLARTVWHKVQETRVHRPTGLRQATAAFDLT